jgi:hypothetical protein
MRRLGMINGDQETDKERGMAREDGKSKVRTGQERRRSVRRNEDCIVRMEGENFSIYSRAANMSERGAFVATHYLLDPGTEISLCLIDPEGRERTTEATVVRTSIESGEETPDVGLGVEFTIDSLTPKK